MVTAQGLSKLNLTIWLTSALVFGVIAAILALVLWYSGAQVGILGWLFISLLFIGIQWWVSPWLIRRVSGAKELSEKQAPGLHAVIAKLAKDAGVPTPKLYFVDDPAPNAFAFGRTQSDAGIAVHDGLLKMLDKDEVEAVLAHEMAHIKHNDVFIMTIASALPVILYYLVLMFSGRDSRNQGAAGFIAVFVGAIIARLFGTLLVMWLSRQREYHADAYAAYATRKPQSLMSALAKISYAGVSDKRERDASLKSFYFADPAGSETNSIKEIAAAIATKNDAKLVEAIEKEKKAGIFEAFMTHPLTAKRLEALLEMKKEIG
jgi:heat shock protein HtpX